MDIIKKIKNYTYNQRYCLGEGSFGRVYQGRSDEGVQIAIKKVQQKMISKDSYLRSSLQSQINIMKKLNHQNIVRLYDVVLTSNSIYLIMQFCVGGDLKRYCRNKKLNEDQAIGIIKQISCGFQQIVKRGIIHRDLKPANILIHQGIFKICDFGFAKFFGQQTKMARTCVGTPIYMSPQVLNQQSYTNKTDIWSLGILCFQLLFGKVPFNGVTQQQLYKNIIRGSLAIPSCSRFTYNLLKGMLQIQESKRHNWNKIFQLFQLPVINEYAPELAINQQQIHNNFYKPKQHKETVKQQVNNFLPQANNYQQKKYHKKPKNPLAYQVLGPPPPKTIQNPPVKLLQNSPARLTENSLLKISQKIQQQEEQNCRFLYFVLIELIVNPIESCESYPVFISSLYKHTVSEYNKKIVKQQSTIYKKVLASELQQLKAIQGQLPNYLEQDYIKIAQQLIMEGKQSIKDRNSLSWIHKLIAKNYDYKPV